MRILVIGAGGVGASMASIAETRSFFSTFVLADISLSRAQDAIASLDNTNKFVAAQVDARDAAAISALIAERKIDIVVNACDPRLNEPIFNAAFASHCNYIDMAMNLSEPHPDNHFPAGIGPFECVNVEHEEVLLIPREIDCKRVTFKYGLGAEFIDWLKTFAYLGLDSKERIRVGDVSVAPRDVLAAVLPNPAKLGHLMHGKTCAGTWVRGTYDGKPRELYLYHVADNETTMRDWGSQAVLWQTAICPVVALELLSNGSWKATGVRGAEAFDAAPFLNLLGEYGAHHGMVEMGPGLWPSPKPTGQPGWDRPVKRAIKLG